MYLPETFISKRSEHGYPIWIIDMYMEIGFGRTVVGDLIYQLKYAKNLKLSERLEIILKHSMIQLSKFPEDELSMRSIDAVVAVPRSPRSDNPLPPLISQTASEVLGIPDWSENLTRIGTDGPAKVGNTVKASMFRVETSLTNRRLLVVDDVYRSGSTMNGVMTSLALAGAQSIVGLCLAKADRGMN
jgi:phosphoribosylpyrophosphate synthetase